MVILWICLFLCVCLSAFFSASETAYSAVSTVRLKMMAADENRQATRALALSEQYDSLLTAILVGNNIVNIAATAMATVLFTRMIGDAGATVSTVVMTILILLFGEVSPKCLAKESPEKLALCFSGPLSVLVKIMKPIDRLFAVWRRFLKKIFRPGENDTAIEDEIITMVDEAQNEGDLEEKEVELIRSAVEFKDLDALSIMTPRVDITALQDTASMEETEQLFLETSYSRVPVYHENLDHIVGILNEKDFYEGRHNGLNSILKIMSEPVFAPNSLPISRLLEYFRSHHTHMVVLVDEFGGTDGIITLEDVLEELVGDIWDEHDDVHESMIPREDGSILVDGATRLEEMLDHFDLTNTYLSDTVGGWVAEILGRIPVTGDRFTEAGLQCTVTKMTRRRVTEVTVLRTAVSAEAREE